jgi:O-antigen/teichoic acid export membrane protein
VIALWSTLARVATMAVSLVCGILTARLAITQGGVEYYAFLSLLVALPSLVSFSDLGTGAVVVNGIATSKDVRTDRRLERQVRTVMRIMLIFAGGIAVINTILLLTGGWYVVLGSGAEVPDAGLAAFVCVSIFCLTICLGIWQRVLLGLGRNPVVILLQGLISPLALFVVWAFLATGSEALKSYLALGSFLATFTVAVIGLLVAIRSSGPLIPRALRVLLSPRRHPGVKVMDVGWPMMAQLLSSPLSMALPRYILAQLATGVAVAQYGVAGQVFFALQALVAAAGVTLWPHFAKARANGSIRRGPFLASGLFGAMIVTATAVILAIGPWLFGIISDGELEITPDIILAFGLMITLQAVLYPLGMFMMDRPGIRFQVAPSLLMAASTVALTYVLVPAFGVNGPLLANAASVMVFQIIPYTVYILRHRDRLYGVPVG